MKTYSQLVESKQIGVLYHYTNIENLLNILKTDKLIGSSGEGSVYISFTRNKNFHKQPHYGISGLGVQIVVDGNKLSNNYKIRPFSYNMHKYQKLINYEINDEMEERVQATKITNIKKYINQINIFTNIALKSEFEGREYIHQQNILHRFIDKKMDDDVNLDDIYTYIKKTHNIEVKFIV